MQSEEQIGHEIPFKVDYDCLVLSGGGIRGVYHLGGLSYFIEKNLKVQEIQTFVGTSIGSVILSLLICGYDTLEIFLFMASAQTILSKVESSSDNFVSRIADVAMEKAKRIHSLFTEYGLHDINILSKSLGEMIQNKLGCIPTFKQLKELTGKTFIVAVTNLTEPKIEYFSHITEPDLSILEAIKMSCNIPILFQKIMYKDCYYVDGGVLDGFPINVVDKTKHKILGFVTKSSMVSKRDISLVEYIYRCLSLPIQHNKLKYDKNSENPKIIELDTDVSPLNFSTSQTELMKMFLSGSQQTEMQSNPKEIV